MSDGVSFTLGRLADALGASLHGDSGRVVRGVAPLDVAGPDQVSFLTDRKYLKQQVSRAGACWWRATSPASPARCSRWIIRSRR